MCDRFWLYVSTCVVRGSFNILLFQSFSEALLPMVSGDIFIDPHTNITNKTISVCFTSLADDTIYWLLSTTAIQSEAVHCEVPKASALTVGLGILRNHPSPTETACACNEPNMIWLTLILSQSTVNHELGFRKALCIYASFHRISSLSACRRARSVTKIKRTVKIHETNSNPTEFIVHFHRRGIVVFVIGLWTIIWTLNIAHWILVC